MNISESPSPGGLISPRVSRNPNTSPDLEDLDAFRPVAVNGTYLPPVTITVVRGEPANGRGTQPCMMQGVRRRRGGKLTDRSQRAPRTRAGARCAVRIHAPCGSRAALRRTPEGCCLSWVGKGERSSLSETKYGSPPFGSGPLHCELPVESAPPREVEGEELSAIPANRRTSVTASGGLAMAGGTLVQRTRHRPA